MSNETIVETVVGASVKLAAPATVSIATIAGVTVSDIVLWATLFYTVLLILHKLWQMFRDFCSKV
jgi:hypothetical protein